MSESISCIKRTKKKERKKRLSNEEKRKLMFEDDRQSIKRHHILPLEPPQLEQNLIQQFNDVLTHPDFMVFNGISLSSDRSWLEKESQRIESHRS
jgi:hypothetical protein